MLDWLTIDKVWMFPAAGIAMMIMLALGWKLVKGRKKGERSVSSPIATNFVVQPQSESVTHGDTVHAQRDVIAAKNGGTALSFNNSRLFQVYLRAINIPRFESHFQKLYWFLIVT